MWFPGRFLNWIYRNDYNSLFVTRDGVNDVTYSIIGILASILLVIINQDIIINQDRQTLTKTQRYYRWFLLGMLAYLITDLLWGVLYSNHLIVLLYADTSIHFIAMVGAVMLWTQYARRTRARASRRSLARVTTRPLLPTC